MAKRKKEIANNCYCLFCRKFFTNTVRFKLICPACEKEYWH